MVLTLFREGCIFQRSSIQAQILSRIWIDSVRFSDRNLFKNWSEIDIFGYSEYDPILDRFQTPFWPHFATIFGAFGMSWAPWLPFWLPGALPVRFPGVSLALLGCLRISKPPSWSILDQHGTILEALDPILEAPGSILEARELHFGGPGTWFWKPWSLISTLQTSKPFQASKPPNFQTSKPPIFQNRLGGMRVAIK